MTQHHASETKYQRLWLEDLLAFAPNSRILSRWQPDQFLDKGQFSRIYRVVHRETGTVGALKLIPNPLETADACGADTPEGLFYRTRFEDSKRETEIMSRFRGEPGVVQYMEEPEFLSRSFINANGETVVQYATLILMPLYRNHKEWLPHVSGDRRKCLQLGMDIAQALIRFEEKGVYHRDIKPGNIMMDNEGHFRLGDVGESKLESEFTTIGFHGTRPYMAPEVLQQESVPGKMRSDHRSDIYSLGIVLYRLFNNHQFPFLNSEGALTEAGTASYKQYMKRHHTVDSTALPDSERARQMRYVGIRLPNPSEADDELAKVILRACAYDKKDRYQTARDFYHALERCLYATPATSQKSDCGRRRKMILCSCTAALVIIAAGTGYLLSRTAPAQPQAVTAPVLEQTAVPAVIATTVPTAVPVATAAPTAVPTAVPTATPSPTATPTPAATSRPIPAAPVAEAETDGIRIRVPELSDDVSTVEIYRETTGGTARCVAVLQYPQPRTHIDTGAEAGRQYTYFYVANCKDGTQYPESVVAVAEWTQKESKLSNLRLRQDSSNPRLLHIEWSDVDGLEYRVVVTRVKSNKQRVQQEVMNELVSGTSAVFEGALPITAYSVTVTEKLTGKQVQNTCEIPGADNYTYAGADCKGGTMIWVSRSGLSRGKDPWELNNEEYPSAQKGGISVSKFAQMIDKNVLYGRSQVVFSRSSDRHTVNALYILRGPNGRDVYLERRETVDAQDGRGSWYWYYPLEDLIEKMSGTDTLTELGSYYFEVYFDECRVSRTEFVLTR